MLSFVEYSKEHRHAGDYGYGVLSPESTPSSPETRSIPSLLGILYNLAQMEDLRTYGIVSLGYYLKYSPLFRHSGRGVTI